MSEGCRRRLCRNRLDFSIIIISEVHRDLRDADERFERGNRTGRGDERKRKKTVPEVVGPGVRAVVCRRWRPRVIGSERGFH